MLKKFSLHVKIDRLNHDMTLFEDMFLSGLEKILGLANEIKYLQDRVSKMIVEVNEIENEENVQ